MCDIKTYKITVLDFRRSRLSVELAMQ